MKRTVCGTSKRQGCPDGMYYGMDVCSWVVGEGGNLVRTCSMGLDKAGENPSKSILLESTARKFHPKHPPLLVPDV